MHEERRPSRDHSQIRHDEEVASSRLLRGRPPPLDIGRQHRRPDPQVERIAPQSRRVDRSAGCPAPASRCHARRHVIPLPGPASRLPASAPGWPRVVEAIPGRLRTRETAPWRCTCASPRSSSAPRAPGDGERVRLPVSEVLASPREVASLLCLLLAHEPVEVFGVRCLSAMHRVVGEHPLSRGTRRCRKTAGGCRSSGHGLRGLAPAKATAAASGPRGPTRRRAAPCPGSAWVSLSRPLPSKSLRKK